MSTLVLLASAIYFLVSVAYLVLIFNKYKICPEFIWVGLQLVMFYGIVQRADYQNASDNKLVILYLVALLCFILMSSLTNRIDAPSRNMMKVPSIRNYHIRYPYFIIVLFASILICSSYFIRGGGNVFLESIQAMITGEEYSTKYARMNMLHVSGTGYVYQLRIAIIPSLVLYYIFVKKNHVLSYVFGALAIIFMLGTGQRGGFVSFMCICILSVYYWQTGKSETAGHRKKQNSIRTYLGIILVALGLFGLTTIMNGRVASGGSVLSAILKRILSDNQGAAIYAFRYIDSEPCQYGYDWYVMLRKLLPGAPLYTSVATRVFAIMQGGSTAGTAPPCIWASAYYNFRVFGVIGLSGILGVVTSLLHREYTTRNCDELLTIIYAGKSFLLGYWLVDGPVTLINSGFVAVCLLEYLMNRIAFKFRIKV